MDDRLKQIVHASAMTYGCSFDDARLAIADALCIASDEQPEAGDHPRLTQQHLDRAFAALHKRKEN